MRAEYGKVVLEDTGNAVGPGCARIADDKYGREGSQGAECYILAMTLSNRPVPNPIGVRNFSLPLGRRLLTGLVGFTATEDGTG